MSITYPAYEIFWTKPKMLCVTVKHILKDFAQLCIAHANATLIYIHINLSSDAV